MFNKQMFLNGKNGQCGSLKKAPSRASFSRGFLNTEYRWIECLREMWQVLTNKKGGLRLTEPPSWSSL